MNKGPDGQERGGARLVVELFGSDANGRKMIAWGRRIGCRDAGSAPIRGGAQPRLRMVESRRCAARRRRLKASLSSAAAGRRAIQSAPRWDAVPAAEGTSERGAGSTRGSWSTTAMSGSTTS
ncbi:MAG: hypothetical protein II840_12000 [Kiritimatiellae bacterium]|nr:hypothetical protein [Kiritimatiellia bacterium]